MATFTQALEWLKQGRKVRRSSDRTDIGYYCTSSNSSIYFISKYIPEGVAAEMRLEDYQATDWQLYDDGQQPLIRAKEGIKEGMKQGEVPNAVSPITTPTADTSLTTELSVSPSLAARILKLAEKESKRKSRRRKARSKR